MKAFISRRDFLKAAGITAAAAALAGCSSSGGSASGSSAGGKTIKIGVFEPASGDSAGCRVCQQPCSHRGDRR